MYHFSFPKVLDNNPETAVIGFYQYLNGKLIIREENVDILHTYPQLKDFNSDNFITKLEELFPEFELCQDHEAHKSNNVIISDEISMELKCYQEKGIILLTLIISYNQSTEDRLRIIRMEEITSEISQAFLSSHYSEIEKAIHFALQKIGQFFNADRVYIFEKSNDNNFISNTHEWTAYEVSPMIDILQDIPLSKYSWFDKKLSKGEMLKIDDVNTIPAENERELIISQDIKSLILLPLLENGRYIGFIGMDSIKSEFYWNNEVHRLLKVISEVIIRGKQKQEIEEELIKSYKQSLELVETSPIGIAIHQDYEIKYINPTGKEILEVPTDSIVNYKILDFAVEHQIQKVKEYALGTYEGRKLGWSEIIVQTLGGHQKLLKYSEIPYNYRDSPASLAFFQDITIDNKIQKELETNEQKFRTLFNASLDGIYISNSKGDLLDWNPSFCRIFGYTSEELSTIDAEELYYSPTDRHNLLRMIADNPVSENIDVVLKHKSGDPIYGLLSINAKLDDYGNLTEIRGIIKDITNLKLTTEALVESERLNSMGLLAGGIAHDINNMLTTISGYASLIREISSNKEISEMIGSILISTDRLRDLTDKLLAYAGKKIKFLESVCIDEEIESIHDFLRVAVSNTVIFTYDLQSGSIVKLDKTQFSQVIINLVTNAVESAEERNLSITIKTQVTNLTEEKIKSYDNFDPSNLAEGRYVRISVIDNGEGMDKSTVSKIFQPFYTTKFEGRGLGLSASLGIIKNHAGAIAVNSTKGEGTRFDIYLPEHENDQQEPNSNFVEISNNKIYSKVLMIDDNPEILEVASQIMSHLGIEFHTTTNIHEFLEFSNAENEFDLLLLDQMMPYMNGIDIIRDLRQERNYTGDIYLMSGYSKDFVDEKLQEYEITGFIQKPLTYDNLKSMLLRE